MFTSTGDLLPQYKDVSDSLATPGLVASPSSPAKMAESQRAQAERWGPLVKKIGLTAES